MKRTIFLVLLICTFLSCSSNGRKKTQQFSGEDLGTTYMVKYFSEDNIPFQRALDSILEEINGSMSTYITKSDISRINREDTTVKVDGNFLQVFNASEKIFKETQGFFDPTVGVLVNAYGFGPGEALKELHTTQLDSLRKLVGFNKVRIRADRTVEKEHPFIYLDFNAIAKGFTIDVIAEYLESKEVENYLVELGGELRAKGKNLESDAEWIVGIDDPDQEEGSSRKLFAKLKLINSAMATSGNYRKYRMDSVTGQKYVHTINPKTGKAERSNILSASVLAENCMLADGYATAFMALGLERTKLLLEKIPGVEVYIIYSTEDAGAAVFQTPGFKEYAVE